MIQRIQSIWLLLASITIACLLFIPMVTATIGPAQYKVFADGIYQTSEGARKLESFLPLLISVIAVSLMAFVNIFNFKNRRMQKMFIMVNIVLIIGLSFWCSVYAKRIPGGLEAANYGIGMFLPVIAIIFSLLALRGIKNDEQLLKSADRLR